MVRRLTQLNVLDWRRSNRRQTSAGVYWPEADGWFTVIGAVFYEGWREFEDGGGAG